jgi:murein DD-endopeptidase MepM/ murein hydrolase activator NlpD
MIVTCLLAALPVPALAATDVPMVVPHDTGLLSRIAQVFGGHAQAPSGEPVIMPPPPGGGPVVASAAGVVIYTGRSFTDGNIVDLRQRNGAVIRYAHLARIAQGITPGVAVHPGQRLGESRGGSARLERPADASAPQHPVPPPPRSG